jgi:hypothetical protein
MDRGRLSLGIFGKRETCKSRKEEQFHAEVEV